MRKRSVLARAVSAMLLGLTACHDLPTAGAPETTAPGASASLNQGQHSGQVPFYCTQGRAAPSGWQTRRLTVFIPRGELDDAGRTVRYEYRRLFADGSRFASASCIVPYTEGALRRLDRAFDVRENGGAHQYRVRDAMLTTQGCVDAETECPLEPIFVKPPPVQPVTNPDDVCTRYPGECDDNDGGDGGDDWENDGGSGDGGADGAEDGLQGDDDVAINGPPDCSKPETLTLAWEKAYCRAMSPEGERLRRTTAGLNAIAAKGGECASIAATGQSLLENGSLRYFTAVEGDKGGWGAPSIGVLLGVGWVDNFGNEGNPNYDVFLRLLVHEVEHTMGRPHLTDAAGAETNETANSRACSR